MGQKLLTEDDGEITIIRESELTTIPTRHIVLGFELLNYLFIQESLKQVAFPRNCVTLVTIASNFPKVFNFGNNLRIKVVI